MSASWLVLALASSVLVFLYVVLTYKVIINRRRNKLPYMVNEDRKMVATFRAHANFNEYVPITLILMSLAVVLKISVFALTLVSVFFVSGRYVHAYGLIFQEEERKFSCRIFGMACTLSVLLILATYNIFAAIAHFWMMHS